MLATASSVSSRKLHTGTKRGADACARDARRCLSEVGFGGNGALKENVDVDGTPIVGLAAAAVGPAPTSDLLVMKLIADWYRSKATGTLTTVDNEEGGFDGFMKLVAFNL